MSASSIQPDPSAIGGVPKTPFALLPNPTRVFTQRAERFDILAQSSRLSSYLKFLADISRIQSELTATLPPCAPVPQNQVERARASAMPPIDRAAIAASAECHEALRQFLERAESVEKPAAAAEALQQVRAADKETLTWMLGNVLSDNFPAESLAHHLYVAAAAQISATRLAATLNGSKLVPIRVGVCPACGGKPAASAVIGFQGAEGARYAFCSCCASQWNEVRVKCLACGSTKGIGYRAVDGDTEEEAVVKAEVCDTCHGWVKIVYQNKNPSLDVIADDVASLGLDVLMKDTEYRRASFNPFLLGY